MWDGTQYAQRCEGAGSVEDTGVQLHPNTILNACGGLLEGVWLCRGFCWYWFCGGCLDPSVKEKLSHAIEVTLGR